MYQFIVLLRAMAAVIITNAHYEEIYPVAIIANGGLLGDVIFFAVSGFCLYDIKKPFWKWYGSRILRIYPAVWCVTLIYIAIGFYHANSFSEIVSLFAYPTYYHFVASIMILYMIYYVIICLIGCFKLDKNRLLLGTLGIVIVMHCIIYFTLYDRSYYHIDSVYEPMIRFLFLEAMLLGAIVKEKCLGLVSKFNLGYVGGFAVMFVGYFVFKLALTRYSSLAPYQILNQFILLMLLLFLILIVAGLEWYIKKIPQKVYKCIHYISTITLEIYLVQYALIPRLNIGKFPVNFLIVSSGILLSAAVLHIVSLKLQGLIVKLFHQVSNKES